MTVKNAEVRGKNTDKDAAGAAHMNKAVVNLNLDDAVMLQPDNRSAITTSPTFSPEIPESDSEVTLDEERHLHPSGPGAFTPSPSSKRNRSLGGSDHTDDRGSDWVFDVFAEDDGRPEGDSWPPSKRARFSSRSSKAAENAPPLAVAVMDVQIVGNACKDQTQRGGQEYKVHQIVGESGSEYEVTAFMNLWLPKVSVGPKLVRKYRAEQRAATRVRTRWSSRLQK